MLALLQLGCQPLVLALSQQVTTNSRNIQVGGIQIDQWLISFFRACGINTLGFRTLEGIIHLPLGEQQPAHRAVSGQFLPGFLLEGLLVHGSQRRTGAVLALDHTQLHAHPMGSTHDHFVDDHYGYRGAGQSVNGYLALR